MVRLSTGAASLVAIGTMVAMSAPAANGSVTPYPGSTTSVRLAKPTFKPTPVRPGKPAHGGTASMAAVNRKHAPWGRSTTKPRVTAVPQLPGIDVSGYQGNINWAAVAPHIDFSYAKATEGTYYTNPDFTNQYDGPYDNGVIRGSYHFGWPGTADHAPGAVRRRAAPGAGTREAYLGNKLR